MTRIIAAVLIVSAAACSRVEASEQQDLRTDARGLSQLEHLAKELDARLGDTEVRAAGLGAEWDAATAGYERAAASLQRAQTTHQRASDLSQAATDRSAGAEKAAREAELMFRIYQALIVAAAQIDARNLDAYRRWGSAGRGDFSCEVTSTAKFRRALTDLGVNLVGKDIDHIVPRSLGGADHPSNYQLLDASKNRSLGNTWNREKCLAAGAQCGEAIAVSKKCGSYRGPWF